MTAPTPPESAPVPLPQLSIRTLDELRSVFQFRGAKNDYELAVVIFAGIVEAERARILALLADPATVTAVADAMGGAMLTADVRAVVAAIRALIEGPR